MQSLERFIFTSISNISGAGLNFFFQKKKKKKKSGAELIFFFQKKRKKETKTERKELEHVLDTNRVAPDQTQYFQ